MTDRRVWSNIQHLAKKAEENLIPEVLAGTLAIVAVGLATALGLSDTPYEDNLTFALAIQLASAKAWALVFGLSGFWVLAMLFVHTRSAAWPMTVLAGTYTLLGFLTLFSVPQGGVPTSVWVYAGMGVVCMITVLVLLREPKD